MRFFKKIKDAFCEYRCAEHKRIAPTVKLEEDSKLEEPLTEVILASRNGEVAYAINPSKARVLELADKLIVRSREIQADPRRKKRQGFWSI